MIAINANGCDRSLFGRWYDARCGICFAVSRRGVSDASVSVALEVAQHQFARRYSARASSSGHVASVSRRRMHAARDIGAKFVERVGPVMKLSVRRPLAGPATNPEFN